MHSFACVSPTVTMKSRAPCVVGRRCSRRRANALRRRCW
jgi:hypothetical protein